MTKIDRNILYITLRSDLGGGPKHLYDLCNHLENVNIYIACPNDPPYFQLYKLIAKKIFVLPHRKFSIIKLFMLIQFIKDNGVSIIHSHGRGAGIYSRIISLWGVKVIHTFHGAHHTSLFEKLMKKTIDRCIAVSESEKLNAAKLKLCSKNNISVIPNSINVQKFKNIKSPNLKIIGIISRLDPHKNNVEIIRFMRELPDYKLLIAGDGEEMEYLKKIANPNVVFLGFVDDIVNFLSKIDIYVSSSLGEGMPYSALEAIAAGKKILLSDVVGHKDLVDKENLYELGNIDSFKSKLEKASSVKLDSKYTIQNMVDKLSIYYKS